MQDQTIEPINGQSITDVKNKSNSNRKAKSKFLDIPTSAHFVRIKDLSYIFTKDGIRSFIFSKENQQMCKNPFFPSDVVPEVIDFMASNEGRFVIDVESLRISLPCYKEKIYPIFIRIQRVFSLKLKTFLMAAFLFFKHLSKKSIAPEKIGNHIVLSYLLISLKFNEVNCPELDRIIGLVFFNRIKNTDDLIVIKKLIIKCEEIIVNELEFVLFEFPYLIDFLEIIAYLNNSDRKLFRFIEQLFMEDYLYNMDKIIGRKDGSRLSALEIYGKAIAMLKGK